MPIDVVRKCRMKGQRVVRAGLSVVRLETSRLRFWGTWLYMRNLERWFQENPVDLAYVSMLKHDAYVVVGAGRAAGLSGRASARRGRCDRRYRLAVVGQFRPDDRPPLPPGGRLRGDLQGHRARAARGLALGNDAAFTISGNRFIDTPKVPRIVAIPNGVPVPETAWQRRPDWRAAPRAVFVGRLAPEKGLDTLIDAWPVVRATYPDARLILIGEGPQTAAAGGAGSRHSA